MDVMFHVHKETQSAAESISIHVPYPILHTLRVLARELVGEAQVNNS